MVPDRDVRWKQRFQNLERAFLLLDDALKGGPGALNPLEKEGVLQRLQCCSELAWKTIKDFLEHGGLQFATATPGQALKDAFAARLLPDGQVWIDMLDHRNLLSHTHDRVAFEKGVEAIASRYVAAMRALHPFFIGRVSL